MSGETTVGRLILFLGTIVDLNFVMASKRKFMWRAKRWCRFLYQRLTRGFDDSVTWNLDSEFATFMLPRLERFIQLYHSYPNPFPNDPVLASEEKRFREDLQEIVWALKFYSASWDNFSLEDNRRAEKGMMLLAQRFGQLWD